MKRVILALLVLGVVGPASAVKIGQTWAEVESELGKPINKLDAPGRSIGRWVDIEVVFVGGRVESIVQRDMAAEAASVLLIDPARRELYFPYVAQDYPQAAATLRALRMPADRGVAGATLQGGRPLRIDDVTDYPRY